MLELKRGSKILFEGDSITDAGRDYADRHSLSGYNKLIAAAGEKSGIECFNRSVSGCRSKDVRARVEAELDELRPDLFSILIGVNDTWRRYDANDPTSREAFCGNLRAIFSAVRARGVKLIVLEPFLIAAAPQWLILRDDLNEKIDATRELAREFADEYVPLDGLFAELSVKTAPSALSEDDVHPTPFGHESIARWWLERVSFGK